MRLASILKRQIILLTVIMVISVISISGISYAEGYKPLVYTIDHISDIIYQIRGIIQYGYGSGSFSAKNPTTHSPLSAINITTPDKNTTFVDNIPPLMNYTSGYAVLQSNVTIPLNITETIIPTSVYRYIDQEVRLIVEIENVGDYNVTDFIYQKSIPSGLSMKWSSYEVGTLRVDNYVVYTIDNIGPREKKNLTVAFDVTPTADIYFPEAYIWYTYNSSLTGMVPDFKGNVKTSFSIGHGTLNNGSWLVDIAVPDNSEFTMILKNVSLYRSSVDNPFSSEMIAYYAPDIQLNPDDQWNTSIVDNYQGTPVYFIKISYDIPISLEQKSYITAKTVPYTITASGNILPTIIPCPSPSVTPSGTPTSQPYPTITPTPYPPPHDIMFVNIYQDMIVSTSSISSLTVSVTPMSKPSYIVFYGSIDNKTWVKIGVSNVYGSLATVNWSMPSFNGKFFLRAERYNDDGFLGVTYSDLIMHQENPAINIITVLTASPDWYVVPGIPITLLLLLGIPLLLIPRKRVIYDSSSLLTLKHSYKDWLSRLSKKSVRPYELEPEFEEIEKIKALKVKDMDEAIRLKDEFGLLPYDALAIQLAKETRSVLYTDDPRIQEICKKLDVKSRLIDDQHNGSVPANRQ